MPRILCVAATHEDLPAPIAHWVTAAGIEIRYCPDVYRAMALIGRWKPAAVLVCVDWLGTADLAFFEVVRLFHPHRPVLVWGGPRCQSRLEAVLQPGTAGLLTEESLASAISIPTANQPTAVNDPGCDHKVAGPMHLPRFSKSIRQPARFHSRATDVQSSRPGLASTNNVFDAQGAMRDVQPDKTAKSSPETEHRAGEPVEPEELQWEDNGGAILAQPPDGRDGEFEDDEPEAGNRDSAGGEMGDTRPVRVPWLRYNDGPKRTPPRPPSRRSAVRPTLPAVDDPPLLSQEELEALLGDEPLDDR